MTWKEGIDSNESAIRIYWDDLTKEKQDEILAALGDNCNYDVFPVLEIPVPEESQESDQGMTMS